MARKSYSVEQIVAAVKQREQSLAIADLCRKLGIAEATFYRWKKPYGGLEPDEVRELKQLREENAKLKRLLADLSLDKVMLQDIAPKVVSVSQRKAAARVLLSDYGISERRACRLVELSRKTFRYRSIRPSQEALRKQIVELAKARVRYGYKRSGHIGESVRLTGDRRKWRQNAPTSPGVWISSRISQKPDNGFEH